MTNRYKTKTYYITRNKPHIKAHKILCLSFVKIKRHIILEKSLINFLMVKVSLYLTLKAKMDINIMDNLKKV